MIQVPPNPGQLILDEVAVRTRPLLDTKDFVKFCDDRALGVTEQRLHRFEELRILRPLVRVKNLGDDRVLHLDGKPTAPEVWKSFAIETSATGADYEVPVIGDPDSMPFYSVYQIFELEDVLRTMDYVLPMEEFVGENAKAPKWNQIMDWRIAWSQEALERLGDASPGRVIPLLGQFLSNRYLADATTDQRTINTGATTSWGSWMQFSSMQWDWRRYRREFDPAAVAVAFCIDRESLDKAHIAVADVLEGTDPLREWSNLLQFVERDKRQKLRGDALRAQTYRELAEMIRLLHRALFDVDLGPPEERFGWTITHVPELEVRKNPREHLEYVVNQFGLNPQARVTLFLEGKSEVAFVEAIFERLFGIHYGTYAIEIVNLKGVDTATGSGKEDRYNAIFRLVDYLHDHQVASFLILDNEGRAKQLKKDAQKRRSIFGYRKYAIPSGRIKVWRNSFELDNFSDTELAKALTEASRNQVKFTSQEVKAVRQRWPQAKLSELYRDKTDRGLNKPELARILADMLFDPNTRRRVESRPVVKVLDRVRRFAALNHPPIFRSTWEHNQAYMDKARIALR